MLTETVAGRTYDYSHNVGRGAQTGMGFNSPVSMTFGPDGTAYVANRGSETISNVGWNRTGVGQRISKLTIGAEWGEEEFLGEFSRYGNGNGQLIWPAGIASDSEGQLFVTDEWLNRVSVFDKAGVPIRSFDTVQPGDSEPNGASGIAISPDGTIYVSDSRSHKVRLFKNDGTFISSFGSLGVTDGQMDSPWGITVDKDGKVYVADFKNHRVQKFSADGQFEAQIGRPGNKRGDLNYPTDVAVDPEGDIYVCDWSKNQWDRGRVHIFTSEGRFLTSLAGDAQQLSHWAQMTVDANADYAKRRREVHSTEPEWTFAQPTAVEWDTANNRLMVVDTQRSRLQIYKKQSGYLVPQLNL
jgi:DNA-binding beta-propeller fold protein YncE